MTLENQNSNGRGADYIHTPINTELLVPYVEPVTTASTSPSDTTTSGTGSDKGTTLEQPGMTPQEIATALLGTSRGPWTSAASADKPYPDVLDCSAAVETGDEFNKKFNAFPGEAKPIGKEQIGTDAEKKPDAVSDRSNPVAEKVPATKEADDPVPAKSNPIDEIVDPFDKRFNEVSKKADAKTNGAPGKADAALQSSDKPDGPKASGSDGQKSPDTSHKKSSDLLSKTLSGINSGIKEALTGLVDQAVKLPEAAMKEGADLASQIGGLFGIGTDQEAARITGNAERGKTVADRQDVQYVKQWRGLTDNGPIAPPKESDDPARYTHENPDKSSYTVTNGKISDFKTPPTKDELNGVAYSDIKYDANRQIQSYSTSFGQTHTRTGPTDANGFASWKSTDTATGKPWAYAGAETTSWRGKPAVDANGFHNLIGSGKNDGTMFSRGMDGSHITTKPEYSRGQMTGLETTTILPDNTQVSQTGHFDSKTHKLEHASTVKVKEADGPKTSQVKFDAGSDKGVIVPPRKFEKDTSGDGVLGIFSDALKPGALDSLKDVKSLSIVHTGPNAFHVDGNLNHVFSPPPIGVKVDGLGPFHRVSATPNGGFIDKFSADLKITGNQVKADVEGLHGSAELTRHKRWGDVNIGSVATSTAGAVWDMNSNTITAIGGDGRRTPLTASNFPLDSSTRMLLSDEDTEKQAKHVIQELEKHLNSASLKQVKPGVFEGTLDLKEKQIALDSPVPGMKASLYLDDKINFTRAAEGFTFKPGEVQLGVQIGNNLESRRDIAKLSNSTNEKGEPVLKVEFHGDHSPINLPMPTKPGAAKPDVATPGAAKPGDTRDTTARPAETKPTAAKPVVASNNNQWQYNNAPQRTGIFGGRHRR